MDREAFDRDVAIEPSQLDIEAVRQGETFFKWAEQSATARGEVDHLKFELETLAARLQFQVRESPEKFGVTKVTEAAIQAAVAIHKTVVEATESWLRARQKSALLDKCVEALEQKKRMIEVLITLHGQEYFAGPSTPHDLAKTYQEYKRNTQEEVVGRQRETARKRVRREG